MRLKTFGGLWIENPASQVDGGPRPRSLALLALLAAAGTKGISRDRALGILWPESDPERARHALSQTVYNLRREIRTDVVLSTPDLRLDSRLITSDVEDFRVAIAAKDWPRAADIYTGPFLDGFYLADAPEFERWVEEERGALSASGLRAIEATARQRTAENAFDEALELWRRLTRLDPVNATFASCYMEALGARGQRTAALAHGKAYADLLRKEFDAEPDRGLQQLMGRLRDDEHRSIASTTIPAETRVETSPPAPAAFPAPPPVPATSGLTTSRYRQVALAAGALALVAITALAWRTINGPLSSRQPVLAVGRLRDLVAPDSAALGGVLSEMLSTSLARLGEVQVVANSRMLELTQREADTSRFALTDAARRAGATEMIEGELIPIPAGQLRLDVRRVDIRRGLVRRGYQISGNDRLALFDSITSLIAADLRVPAPTTTLAEVSTRSPLALRLYEEGLRAFYQYDIHAAGRLFRAAVREDSTFAMAVYYAWRSAVAVQDMGHYAIGKRALALASRAPERDRLLILTHVGFGRSDPRSRATAESLAAKYPGDPEALIRAVDAIQDLSRAIPLLERSIALDSAAGAGSSGICRLCDALGALSQRYLWADSIAAYERTLERWKRLRPDDFSPWTSGADLLIGLGRRADAEAALRRGIALGAPPGDANDRNLQWALRTDDVDTVNALCRQALTAADSVEFITVRWYCTIGLRMQGRYRDALALNREGRVPGTGVVRHRMALDDYNAAILDLEMGRPLVAADAFAAMGTGPVDTMRMADSVVANNLTWWKTLSATAAVAGGDTIRARALVDTIEMFGTHSIFSRDPVLHHFVRGLLYSRAGRNTAAVNEFRTALVSPTFGYTRINYELALSLIAMSRAAEAIPILQAPLHGGIEGSDLYLTRTESHELLARAFDLTGQRDSAAAHYAVVERAWRQADPFLQPRYQAARGWLVRAGRLSR